MVNWMGKRAISCFSIKKTNMNELLVDINFSLSYEIRNGYQVQ